jgi:hypothetical protein
MRVTVPKDHIEMNKFDSEGDPGFQTVVHYITAMIDSVRASRMEVLEAERAQQHDADRRCVKVGDFPVVGTRLLNNHDVQSFINGWTFKTPFYAIAQSSRLHPSISGSIHKRVNGCFNTNSL